MCFSPFYEWLALLCDSSGPELHDGVRIDPFKAFLRPQRSFTNLRTVLFPYVIVTAIVYTLAVCHDGEGEDAEKAKQVDV